MLQLTKKTPRLIAILLALILSASFAIGAHAQSEFAPGENFIEEVYLRDLPISTAIAFASSDKAYLALKIGIIQVVEKGKVLPTPFIDISAVVNKHTDRGLLGLAVDPDFPRKPFLYISYVYDPPGSVPDSNAPRVIRIARLTADAAKNYNVALPDSLEVIVGKNSTLENMAPPVPLGDPNIPERASCMTGLTMDGTPIEDCIACDATSHTAGTLIFGANRVLYASLGDGADYNGPTRVGLRTQNIDSLSGRVLRFNPDTGQGLPDNPWYDSSKPSSNRSRTWSYGFRNPFRITLHPNSEDVYIGDVGTSYYEEINAGKGSNFGWPCYEGGFTDRNQQEGEATASVQQVGYRAHPRTTEFCAAMYAKGASFVRKPLFNYRHPYDETGKDLGSSITGLAFYSGKNYPEKYRGALFYADYARLFIRYLTFDQFGKPTTHDFAREVGSNLGAVELLSGPDKNIYAVYIDLKTRTSQVRRFRPAGDNTGDPVVRASVDPLFGEVPLVVNFSASKSFDPGGQALTFNWDFGDGTKSNEADPQHIYQKAGTYTAKIKVTQVGAPYASAEETFTIRSGSEAPEAVIDEPGDDLLYEIGKEVRFSGQAGGEQSDDVSLSWTILQIHNQHTHLVAEVEGGKGSFIPTEHSDNTAYELCLVASRGEGLSDQDCVLISPRTSRYTFNSSPPGATISYLDEETDVVAPHIAYPIVGSEQSIKAPLIHAGKSFARWSDGNLNTTRSFVTGATPTLLNAIYVNRSPKASIAAGASTSNNRRKRYTLLLDASSSRDPEGESLKFSWRFSDRKNFSGPVIKRTFTRFGTYRLRLNVRDALGAETELRKTISVTKRRGARLL